MYESVQGQAFTQTRCTDGTPATAARPPAGAESQLSAASPGPQAVLPPLVFEAGSGPLVGARKRQRVETGHFLDGMPARYITLDTN